MTFEQVMASGEAWALPIAAAGGVIAGLNPCCLALYPAVGATCCASVEENIRRVVFSRALLLVLGVALGTTVLGMAAAIAGHALAGLDRNARYALAFVPIIAGLHLAGVVRLPLPVEREWRRGTGALAAFGTGMFLSLVVSACGTPVLASVLSYAAYEGSVAFGALLLFSYGIGNGLPLLLFGTGLGAAAAGLGARAQRVLNGLAALTFVVFGFYLLLDA